MRWMDLKGSLTPPWGLAREGCCCGRPLACGSISNESDEETVMIQGGGIPQDPSCTGPGWCGPAWEKSGPAQLLLAAFGPLGHSLVPVLRKEGGRERN